MRVWILVAAVVVGVAMWLVINRTRIGMLVRAGVDDREMLAASGLPIQLVFVLVFAFGAGLAGLARIVSGTFRSIPPGRIRAFCLRALSSSSSADAPFGALGRVPVGAWAVAAVLLLMPAFANNFILFQVFGWTFILGMIALSLMFLAGYGGMVSLIQMTVAGLAGYMVAILGPSGTEQVSLGLPWWINIPVAVMIATLFGTLVGVLAVRTEGIYTIMITLAIAAAFFYFTRQNYTIFNGYNGFSLVVPPQLFGIDWRQPTAFYYLSLGMAVVAYGAVVYVSRSPFGLALQGVRDNARRMAALGYNVVWHRILAYSFAAVIASFGGILLAWQNAQIAPGAAGIPAVIDILVIAVVGGMRHPIGAFIGAFIYVLLSAFAPDVLTAFGLAPDRFKLIVGLGFLAVVAFSPDGVLGLWARAAERRCRRVDPLTGAPR